MDKFGIFNLLNSLFDLYKNNAGNSTKEGASPIGDLLKNFTKPASPQPEKPQPPPPQTPLQAEMLATMRNHDRFVKRVQTKNSKA